MCTAMARLHFVATMAICDFDQWPSIAIDRLKSKTDHCLPALAAELLGQPVRACHPSWFYNPRFTFEPRQLVSRARHRPTHTDTNELHDVTEEASTDPLEAVQCLAPLPCDFPGERWIRLTASREHETGLRRTVKYFLDELEVQVRRQRGNPEFRMLGLPAHGVRTAVDMGAHKGQPARQAIKRFPEAGVYSFEPRPGVFKHLDSWARATSQVKAFNAALGPRNEVAQMFKHIDQTALSSLLQTTFVEESLYPATRKQGAISVRVRRLDDLVSEESLDLRGPLLIKMDGRAGFRGWCHRRRCVDTRRCDDFHYGNRHRRSLSGTGECQTSD